MDAASSLRYARFQAFKRKAGRAAAALSAAARGARAGRLARLRGGARIDDCRRMVRLILLMLLVAVLAAGSAAAGTARKPVHAERHAAALHVASPDWRDQVIYFVMTDRFDDGDPRNDDQHAGEFDAASDAKYNGGDLRGIARRLDYIRGLGATAIWITPPVANLWWNPKTHYGGYHGYWAENFKEVDAHLGSLRDYQDLSKAIHRAGMYLVQDIVLNHTGNYFAYEGGWRADDPAAHFRLDPDSRGRTAPSQWPFSQNDARKPADRAAAIYHWTPDIADFNDPAQVANYQMGGLDDLDSENPRVRDALRDSYGYWIREAGVDGFRLDTAFYVPPDAIADFLYSDDPRHPGVMKVAQATGRSHFHVFGEGFATDKPFHDEQARRIEAYMHRADGSTLMPGMLDFPLYASIGDVFAHGRPTAELAWRIASRARVHRHPELMPTFIDNHDVDRFLASGSRAGLQQGLLLLMTLPGIPTIYYGTEQGFTERRASMFRQGSGSGGVDHFDASAPLYRFIQRATALRREHRLFSRGTPTVLAGNAAAPGVLAYRMDAGADSAIVVLNSADHEVLLDRLDTGAPAGSVLQGLFDIQGQPADVVAGDHGLLTMRLPPRAGKVWLVTHRHADTPPAEATIAIDGGDPGVVRGDFVVSGSARGVRDLRLVVDGDLGSAQAVVVDASGRWKATVETGSMIDPAVEHAVVAWDEASRAVSPARRFKVETAWRELADVADPRGDDDGPAHRYVYPAEAGWRDHHPADIERVRISGAGGALRISLRMHAIVSSWNAPNGFDHVAFSVFLQVPGQGEGATAMPFQNARVPDGMRWNYRLRTNGWANALFQSAGATATHDGTPLPSYATVTADAAAGTVDITLPGAALGGLRSLAGVKVYVATWDFDGGYRPLRPEAGASAFGGGDGAVDPLVMDDTGVIVLP